jgi:hypothetical protein
MHLPVRGVSGISDFHLTALKSSIYIQQNEGLGTLGKYGFS